MFLNIDYLKSGNERQRLAYKAILETRICSELVCYTPVLCGTIPIELDLDQSDLDIIMEVRDFQAFRGAVTMLCGAFQGFHVEELFVQNLPTMVVNFSYAGFLFELFGQPLPVQQQNAYRHMRVEHALLMKDPKIKEEVIRLKRQGIKTEPAFAQILQLHGDPYAELIRLGERMELF